MCNEINIKQVAQFTRKRKKSIFVKLNYKNLKLASSELVDF